MAYATEALTHAARCEISLKSIEIVVFVAFRRTAGYVVRSFHVSIDIRRTLTQRSGTKLLSIDHFTGLTTMQRWLVWGCFLLGCFCVGTSMSDQSVFAQEAAPAAAPAPAAAAPPEHKPEESMLWWIIVTSGWIGGFLLVLSMYFIATTGRLFTELRPIKVIPPEVTDQCTAALEKRDLKGLYAVVKEEGSEYSRLVRAGIAELPAGLPEARAAMERTFEVIYSEGERKISMLAVLGTLGTLKGMIGAFSEIAMSEGTVLKASAVAGEISEALLLTFEGVMLSVPAIYLHAVFRNKISHLNEEAFNKAEELVSKVASMAKRPPAAAQASPPSA
jgi:biopolymer transport protein ExbB